MPSRLHAESPGAPEFSSVQRVLSEPGRPLVPTVRGEMESRFSHDFGHVRIHAGGEADRASGLLGAEAWTVGNDVAFSRGRYDAGSDSGRRLLAHELTHVVQHDEGRSGAPPGAEVLRVAGGGGPLEAEARASSARPSSRGSQRVAAGPSVNALAQRGAVLHRQPTPGDPQAGDVLLENASPLLAGAVGSLELAGFATGSAELTPGQQAQIRTTAHNIVVLLRQYPGSTVRVTGHTDTVGSEEGNVTLGTRRAESVRAALVAGGVPEINILAESSGAAPPQAVRTRANVANARNRRVVVHFEPQTSRLRLSERRLGDRPPNLVPPPGSGQLTGGGSAGGAAAGGAAGGRTGSIPAPRTTFEEVAGGLIQTGRLAAGKEPHPALDLSSGVTANAPRGASPTTYTITAIFRNLDLLGGDDDAAVAFDLLFHEPNLSIILSPDPQNRLVFQAAFGLVNMHIRRHRREFLEVSLSPLGTVNAQGTPGGGAQLQAELHLTSRFSLTGSTALGFGPHDPTAPPDRGSIFLGTRGGLDWTWQPFTFNALVHFR